MPRGSIPGERRGGRKKGTPNKRTAEVRTAAAATLAAAQASADPNTLFRGDAHALFVLVYQDKTLPLDVRLDAAKSAVRFETPALSTVENKGEIKHVIRRTPMTPREWAIERAGQDTDDLGAAAGPANRPH